MARDRFLENGGPRLNMPYLSPLDQVLWNSLKKNPMTMKCFGLCWVMPTMPGPIIGSGDQIWRRLCLEFGAWTLHLPHM